MPVIRAPRCPGCDQEPFLVVGDRQAFCGTGDCRVFTWDRFDDPALFKAKAKVIDLPTWLNPETP